ncbi:MAG: urease accessory protein UreF [Nitrospiria bacterium]
MFNDGENQPETDQRSNFSGNRALIRLFQLVSPYLPVGAFSYSQGLEWAVHVRWINTEKEAREWIFGALSRSLSGLEIPVLARFYQAWKNRDRFSLKSWAKVLNASRESRELREEDKHLGSALARLLFDLRIKEAEEWIMDSDTNFLLLFSLASVYWEIPLPAAGEGYAWSRVENQVVAAVKLIPLGQTAGQRIMLESAGSIPQWVDIGLKLKDEEIGFFAPGLAMASALHETLYSRLFRS